MWFSKRLRLVILPLLLIIGGSAQVFAALPTVLFNTATGSDTAASGAGPATALTGTGAATATSTAVTLSADTPNLSGVATDGSAVLWVLSSSGLQYSKITGVDDTTDIVTVATAYANTEASRTWAIGGKRATLDATTSRILMQADVKAGWTIQLEDNQTISSTLTPTTAGAAGTGWITIKGDSATTRRTITNSANAATFTISSASADLWRFENLTFANSNGTKTSANAVNYSATGTYSHSFVNCSTDATNKHLRFINRSSATVVQLALIGNDINNTTGTEAVNVTSSSQGIVAFGNACHNNAGHCFTVDAGRGLLFIGNVFYANAGVHLRFTESGVYTSLVTIIGNTFDGSTGANSGVDWSGVAANSAFSNNLIFANNIITNNGSSGTAYGVNARSTVVQTTAFNAYNDYNGNRTAATLNWTTGGASTLLGINDLAVDPSYTNAAGGDFSVGTAVKALGFPDNTANRQAPNATIAGVASGTPTYVDLGSAQRVEPTGGGGFVGIIGGM